MLMPSTHRQGGTSLVETLFATAICMIAVFGLAGLVSMSTRQTKEMGTTVAQATALAAQKLDDLMSRPFGDAQLSCASPPCGNLTSDASGFVEYLRVDGTATTATAVDVFFTRRWQVNYLNSSPTTLKGIRVWVGGRPLTPASDASRPSATLGTIKASL